MSVVFVGIGWFVCSMVRWIFGFWVKGFILLKFVI